MPYGLPNISQSDYQSWLAQQQATLAQQQNQFNLNNLGINPANQPATLSAPTLGASNTPQFLGLLNASSGGTGFNDPESYQYIPNLNGSFGVEVKTGPMQGTTVPYALQNGQYVPQTAGDTSQYWNTSAGNAFGPLGVLGVLGGGLVGGVLAGAGAASDAGAAGTAAAGGTSAAAPSFIGAGSTPLAGAGAGVADTAAGTGTDFLSSLFSGGSLFGGSSSGGISPMIWSSLIQSGLGAFASNNAANIQANAAQQATQAQLGMFNQVMGNLAPYRQTGIGALNALNSGMNTGPGGFLHQFNAGDLQSQLAPNYQFQLGQGLGQLQNQGAAAGGAMSGNTLAGLNAFAQNYASGAYQNAFENYMNQQNAIYSRLGNLAQLGQVSATGGASGAPFFAGGISNTLQGIGAAGAAGQVGVANAIGGGVGNLGQLLYLNSLQPNVIGGTGPQQGFNTTYGNPATVGPPEAFAGG